MIYQIKLYFGSRDGGVTDYAGSVLVIADSEPVAHGKAQAHWYDLIKAQGSGGVAMQATLIDAEAILT
jgi:hypothetical protein